MPMEGVAAPVGLVWCGTVCQQQVAKVFPDGSSHALGTQAQAGGWGGDHSVLALAGVLRVLKPASSPGQSGGEEV